MPGSVNEMGSKSKRSYQPKLPDRAVPGSGGSIEPGPPARATGGLPVVRAQEEQDADRIEPPRISVVGSAQVSNVARNLLPELMEEGLDPGDEPVSLMMDVTDLTSSIEEISVGREDAATPITKAVNAVPPKMDPTVPSVRRSVRNTRR